MKFKPTPQQAADIAKLKMDERKPLFIRKANLFDDLRSVINTARAHYPDYPKCYAYWKFDPLIQMALREASYRNGFEFVADSQDKRSTVLGLEWYKDGEGYSHLMVDNPVFGFYRLWIALEDTPETEALNRRAQHWLYSTREPNEQECIALQQMFARGR